MTHLVVDSRENQLLDLLLTHKNVSKQQMNVGDFLFTINDQPILVIERKTYQDLASSIQGGRYHEQKARLQAFKCPQKAYLIEGPRPNGGKMPYSKIPVATLDSAILSTSIRDNFQLIFSQNKQHSCELLLKLQKKLAEWSNQPKTSYTSEPLLNSLSTTKSENMDPKTCYLAQLIQIPGVSTVTAQTISASYPNMWVLLQLVNNTPIEAEKQLSNLKNNGRKLGTILAQKIITYLKATPKQQKLKIKLR